MSKCIKSGNKHAIGVLDNQEINWTNLKLHAILTMLEDMFK